MNALQISALTCAYADLVGVYQCAIRDRNGGENNGHDWGSHRQSIIELEQAFPDLIEPAPLGDNEQDEDWPHPRGYIPMPHPGDE
jgi:hypothetical protein